MAKSEDSLAEMLKLQLLEIDMLQSMFPNHGEFQVDDPSAVADVAEYVECKSNKLPARIDFVLHLEFDDKVKFELSCSLPHDYPSTEPEVFVRSQKLNRSQQHQLNEDLLHYVASVERGEVCVYSIIQWLQEQGMKYVSVTGPERQESQSDTEDKEKYFTRYWIYSHHIYNKMKRRNILELAKEMDLSGFCLPGKPGIICAEGTAMSCGEFWHRVKHMNWKKIMCKMKEQNEINNGDIENLRRFNSFEEIHFEVRRGPGREYHMDMGEFLKYLEQHQCGYAFKNYFGVEGKLAAHE